MNNERIFDQDRPYIFISYSHRNKDEVEKTIQELYSRYGINIWYDKELFAGGNWDDVALPKLRDNYCKAVLFFGSIDALTSKNVEYELNKAEKYHKTVIPVNFGNISFDKLLEEINTQFNRTDPEKVNIAERIVEKHLNSRLTYIVLNTEQDEYYEQICHAIRNNASEVEINSAVKKSAPASKPEVSAPAPEHKPASAKAEIGEKAGKGGADNITYTLFGETFAGNQNQLFVNVFQTVMNRYPEKYDELIRDLNCLSDRDLKNDPDRKNVFFTCKTFVTDQGKTVCVALKLSKDAKEALIARLFKICGLPNSTLQSDDFSPKDQDRLRNV